MRLLLMYITWSFRSVRFTMLLLAGLLLLPALAWGTTLTVGCAGAPSGTYDHTTLNAAIAALAGDLNGNHRIEVRGTCTETIRLFNFQGGIIIQGPATIVHTAGPPEGLTNVVTIRNSRIVRLNGLIIRGGARGVVVRDYSAVFINTCTVEENLSNGIFATELSILHVDGCLIQNNGGQGLRADRNSTMSVADTTSQNNGSAGIACAVGAFCQMNGNVASLNNQFAGFTSNFGAKLFMFGDPTANVFNTARGNNGQGLFVGNNSSVSAGELISENNTGPGITVDASAVLQLFDSTVRNNTEEGICLTAMALARLFVATDPPSVFHNILTGNGTASITCDESSILGGDDLPGIKNITCKQILRDNGQVRPGRLKEPKEPKEPD